MQMLQMGQIPQIKIKKSLINVIGVISVSGSDGFIIFFFSSSLTLPDSDPFFLHHSAFPQRCQYIQRRRVKLSRP